MVKENSCVFRTIIDEGDQLFLAHIRKHTRVISASKTKITLL